MMDSTLIDSPVGVMAVLVAVVSFWFWLEKKSGKEKRLENFRIPAAADLHLRHAGRAVEYGCHSL
jgi:hypothetical protein